jgi:hypothetical protein
VSKSICIVHFVHDNKFSTTVLKVEWGRDWKYKILYYTEFIDEKNQSRNNLYVIGSRLYYLALYITFFHNTVMFLTMGREKYLV